VPLATAIDAALSRVGQLPAGGPIISSDSFFFARSERLAALAARHSVRADEVIE